MVAPQARRLNGLIALLQSCRSRDRDPPLLIDDSVKGRTKQ
jgi:hypothetical protein